MVTKWHLVVFLFVLTHDACDAAYKDAARRRMEDARRVRREYKEGFTQSEKRSLVDLHNKFRMKEPARNMLRMEWDNEIEAVAQHWADRCVWSHSGGGENRLDKFSYIGENLFASTTPPTPTKIVEDWYNETIHYTFSTGRCNDVCGHYTQVVWAKSYALGCGIRFCPDIQFLDWRRHGGGYVVVCNYGPGGNYIGEKPYSRGQPACSLCPHQFSHCSQGLCSRSNSDRTSGNLDDNTRTSGQVTLHSNTQFYVMAILFLASIFS